MAARPYMQAIFTALATAAAGAVLLILSGQPALAMAGAVVAAAASVLISLRGRETAPTDGPPRPVETDTGATTDAELGAVRDLLQALPVGVMIIGADRTVRFANRNLEQMIARTGLAGIHVTMLRAPRLLDRIDAALNQRTASQLEFALSRASDAALLANVRPLASGDVLVAIEDETQRKRAEELHRDFVANASHELKTPLAASTGIIETLLGHARDDPEATERFLGMLSAQTARMTRLVEDLMSLNRIELNARVLPEEPQDLVRIVHETVDALRPIADAAGVSLVFDEPGTPLEVVGSRDELGQLFGNLVDNAIKYSGRDTTVRVRRVIDDDSAPGMIGLAVEDQGIGISREHLPRLTERFYRVNVRRSREMGGTGLGLAIVKHILNRHRGRIEVQSTPGKGSRFTVWLPARQAAEHRSDTAAP